MILFMMLNIKKVSAEKTLLKKQHSGGKKECLTIMVEMLNPIS